MKLFLDWGNAVKLKKIGRRYTGDLTRCLSVPGIYVFGRRYGEAFEALYVGKSKELHKRLDYHLSRGRKVVQHLRRARKGRRYVLFAQAATKQGQQSDRVLRILERAFIRHYLSEGHDLMNKQGVRIRRHEISSSRDHFRRHIPAIMFVEKAKRE